MEKFFEGVLAVSMMDRLVGMARLASFTGRGLLPHVLPRRLLRLLPVVTPEQTIAAPPELIAGNADIAANLYAGFFILAGHAAAADGGSIFRVQPPSNAWETTLHSFSWLTHLRASNTTLSRIQARALIDDWLINTAHHQARMSSQVTAQRVIAWLMHAPFILEGASPKFHRRFLKSLARQIRRLRWEYATAPSGLPKLYSALAQTMAGLCLAESTSILKVGSARLASELKKQILPDGTHISRDPGMILTALGLLLPLKKTFVMRELQPPEAMLNAIDRMMPMVRFFRHGDGNLALFNGMGATPLELVEAISAFDDAMGRPVLNAPHGGYQRLEGKELVALVDTGKPPPLAVSQRAHAGTLSFELSSAEQRMIVNCGAPDVREGVWSFAARATAAHSTASLNEASSSRFLRGKWLQKMFGTLIVSGPRNVVVSRTETDKGEILRTSHDGYLRRFGVVHERTLRVSPEGNRIDGVDSFKAMRRIARGDAGYTLRFHLHPDVKALYDKKNNMVQLVLGNGEKWVFALEGALPALEESVHLADPRGVRRAEQIVVQGKIRKTPRIAWALTRID